MVKLFEQANIRTTLNDPGRISDLAIAVGWKKLIEANYSQVIVIHDSLLPKYRGFNPLLTALINGDTRIGATALIATDEVDAGPIVAQEAKSIKYPMKLEEAMQIISSLIEKLLRRVCYQIEKSGKATGKPQNHRIATYSLWRDEEDFQIDWTKPADVVVRHIHASSYPYAGAKSFLADEEIRIFDAKISKENPTIVNRTPGKIWKLTNGVPVVICGKGLVELTKVSGNNGRSVLPITKLKQRFK
jgi:methionyl-tRNA formyltransferase